MNNLYFYISKILAPLLNPTNFLFIFLLILFYLYFFLNKNRIIKKLFYINLLIIFLISFLPIGNLGLQFLENEFRNKTKIENVENIIVLSGDDKRILASIKLAIDNQNAKIFFVGGSSFLVQNKKYHESNSAKEMYNNLNFDVNRINFVAKSRNTIENIKDIEALNLKNQNNLLITSAFHMKRVVLISEKFNLNFTPYPVDFRSSFGGHIINNYQSFDISSNLSDFNIFFREIIGIIAFEIFY